MWDIILYFPHNKRRFSFYLRPEDFVLKQIEFLSGILQLLNRANLAQTHMDYLQFSRENYKATNLRRNSRASEEDVSESSEGPHTNPSSQSIGEIPDDRTLLNASLDKRSSNETGSKMSSAVNFAKLSESAVLSRLRSNSSRDFQNQGILGDLDLAQIYPRSKVDLDPLVKQKTQFQRSNSQAIHAKANVVRTRSPNRIEKNPTVEFGSPGSRQTRNSLQLPSSPFQKKSNFSSMQRERRSLFNPRTSLQRLAEGRANFDTYLDFHQSGDALLGLQAALNGIGRELNSPIIWHLINQTKMRLFMVDCVQNLTNPAEGQDRK